MKKLIKWMLGLGVAFLIIGLGLVIAGVSLGAGISDVRFLKDMGYRALHIRDFSTVDSVLKGEEDLGEVLEKRRNEEDSYEEYEGALKTEYSTHFGASTYKLDQVKNLEINLIAGELLLEAYDGDEIKVKVDHDHKDVVKVSSGDDFLKIESTKKIHHGDVIVYYPEKMKLEQLKVEVDAGTVILEDSIETEFIYISIGAGELEAKGKLFTKTSMIEVGAGEVDIAWISTDSLEGNCGIGEMNLQLEGDEEDYNYQLKCGLGEIKIGDNSHSSIADREEIRNRNTTKNISLSCGMGEIEIEFD